MNRRLGTLAAVAVLPFALLGCTPSAPAAGSGQPAATGAAAPAAAAPKGGVSVADFCSKFGDDMILNSFAGAGDYGDLDREKAKRELRALGDAAPAEIKKDLSFVIDADVALINGEPGSPQRMTSPDYQAAMDRFTTWWTKNCGKPAS
ncbi:hypothetical protein Lfu02_06670 [Longispora fulva]|uniref:Uncharacterized protein n=1 Tax=Longispora fulva TaxID=619741 RepID=A0A8J7GPD8_9ACTN|nr:hypothetical protein [Longispora fulva]MBG6135463.1 hypothetical protein [Longispora fulva]GIG56295.1 hypothetical protein Lfu02_06670 [Longispora fulva]